MHAYVKTKNQPRNKEWNLHEMKSRGIKETVFDYLPKIELSANRFGNFSAG